MESVSRKDVVDMIAAALSAAAATTTAIPTTTTPPLTGAGGHAMENFNAMLNDTFLPLMKAKWTFPFAMLCTLQVFLPGNGSQFLRTLGKGIIVFQIYYAIWLGASEAEAGPLAFTFSCLYLLFDEAILPLVVDGILWLFPKLPFLDRGEDNVDLKIWHVDETWPVPVNDGCLVNDAWQKIRRQLPSMESSGSVESAGSVSSEALLPTNETTSDVETGRLISEEELRKLKERLDEENTDKDATTAWNVYMDFRKPFRVAVLVFVAQVGLFSYYVFEMNGGDDPGSPGRDSHDPGNASFVKWWFAIVLVEVAGGDEIGPSIGKDYWQHKFNCLETEYEITWWNILCSLFTKWIFPCLFPCLGWTPYTAGASSLKATQKDKAAGKAGGKYRPGGDRAMCFHLPPWAHVFIRYSFDFMINAVARSIVRGTVPIMLCVEGPLDFVKDVCAVFFLLKLDDIENDRDLGQPKVWDFANENIDYELETMTDTTYRVDELRCVCELARPSKVAKYVLDKKQKNKEGLQKTTAADVREVQAKEGIDVVQPTQGRFSDFGQGKKD